MFPFHSRSLRTNEVQFHSHSHDRFESINQCFCQGDSSNDNSMVGLINIRVWSKEMKSSKHLIIYINYCLHVYKFAQNLNSMLSERDNYNVINFFAMNDLITFCFSNFHFKGFVSNESGGLPNTVTIPMSSSMLSPVSAQSKPHKRAGEKTPKTLLKMMERHRENER